MTDFGLLDWKQRPFSIMTMIALSGKAQKGRAVSGFWAFHCKAMQQFCFVFLIWVRELAKMLMNQQ